MKKIKTWLIHWLGGVTEEESKNIKFGGELQAYYDVKDYADNNYGTDWREGIYDLLNSRIEEVEDDRRYYKAQNEQE